MNVHTDIEKTYSSPSQRYYYYYYYYIRLFPGGGAPLYSAILFDVSLMSFYPVNDR